MRLKEIQHIFHKELDAIYDTNEVDSFFLLLIEAYYKISRLQMAMDPNIALEDDGKMVSALDALKNEVPIQYIIGETVFFGLPFKVDENVLIPRPETEELVDWIIKKTTVPNPTILDIGTGSGCIAVTLAKKMPEAKVFALDVSKEALEVATENAILNETTVDFLKADILDSNTWSTDFKKLKFDVVVSNPPYVREQEKARMKSNVVDNEPHLALFVSDENPLQFYKAITNFSTTNLKVGGRLFFEINEYLGNDMIQLLKAHNFVNIELKQDIFKRDRMIKGQIQK
ncbi:peptide chain release factor N(5)-glutamine methyltransferase [Flavobacteriaceae bacterium XHP0103]|uniref:peptide chain release factor N(5)-glutamine methyltransferase n=1 Tax=Marixanthotalea marina TaxID=2844359 RepID=UPI002989E41F|nr:peptide chain release factor N(5)-glutamine methyltransferase [Marixanthotalea marina]MBU3822556.1 peptide chain release factor N(5)-glutamine methyltransferase [Marixanthotalea marina]